MPLSGSQLEYARAVLEWTQQNLADLSGVEAAVISDFELGNITFDSEQEAAIINAFAAERVCLGLDGTVSEVTQLYFMAETKKAEFTFKYPIGQNEILKDFISLFGAVDNGVANISLS